MNGKAGRAGGRPVAVANLHPSLRLDARSAAVAIRVLDRHHRSLATAASVLENTGSLSVAVMTDSALAGIHGRFLADPAATDVITFEGDPGLGTAGEICISADAAARFAAGQGGDTGAELALYLVHGWLHLAGHDDRSPGPRRAMRRAEARALACLRAAQAMPRLAAPKKTRAKRRPRG